jgi:hypothetical protein
MNEVNREIHEPREAVLVLAHFDQVETLARSLVASNIPKMQILVRGNILWKGSVGNFNLEEMKSILFPIEWLQKCRWIAQHCNINPILPNLKSISVEQWDTDTNATTRP